MIGALVSYTLPDDDQVRYGVVTREYKCYVEVAVGGYGNTETTLVHRDGIVHNYTQEAKRQ